MGMTNEQLLQSITTVIVDRFDIWMEESRGWNSR